MNHLSESEVVDLIEETLEPRRAAHVEGCAACRELTGRMRALLRDVASEDVPEPSPLFWDQFSARVHDEVARQPEGRPSWAWAGLRVLAPLALAAGLAVAVFSGVQLVRAARLQGPPSAAGAQPVQVAALESADPGSRTLPDAENAEAWDVLTAAAASVGFEDAHEAGMHVHPATIDHAVQNLSAAERAELGRLLQSELKRASN